MTDDVGRAAVNEAQNEWFAHFRLRGKRFTARGMPAETAVEVARYRAALYEAARKLWLDLNPDRSNVPGGFEAAFDLRLVTIDGGSAQPRVQLHRPSRFQKPEYNEWFDVYGQARETITEALASIADDGVLPQGLDPRTRQALRRMGSSLGEDEEIELGEPSPEGKRATLDAGVRKTLKDIDNLVEDPVTEQVSAIGVIVEFDSIRNSFVLSTEPSGLRVQCQLQTYVPELNSTIKQVMAEDGVTAPDVEVSGFVVRDGKTLSRTILNVLGIVEKRSLQEKRLRSKLSALSSLPAGWRGPGSLPLSTSVNRTVELVLPAIGHMAERIALAASPDGHAVFEWSRGAIMYTAEIEPQNQMYLCVDNRHDGQLEDWEAPFDQTVFESFLTGVLPG